MSWLFNVFQEVKQIETMNEQQLSEMQQRHAAERRRLPKILKTETKTRTQMFKKSLRINVSAMTPEQELEKIQEVSDQYSEICTRGTLIFWNKNNFMSSATYYSRKMLCVWTIFYFFFEVSDKSCNLWIKIYSLDSIFLYIFSYNMFCHGQLF